MMEGKQPIPVLSFIAKSGSGKTTLLEKVIKQLKTEGLKLAVIKHDAHSFEMDKPGKDTWKMAQAGADIVAISSPEKVAIIERVAKEKTLDDLIGRISGVDIILTEGFKMAGKPAIEVFRSSAHQQLLEGPIDRVAIVSDVSWDIGVPCYHLDDIPGVVEEIKRFLAKNHK